MLRSIIYYDREKNDSLSNLCFALPPEYQNSKNLTGLCYEYRYDGRHRCTWKRLPGCEPVEYWYDRGDRIVCFRDGELRADGLFRFFLYDKLGRLSVQGLCTSCATGENDIPVVSYTPVFSGFGGSLYQIPAGKAQPQNAEIELVNYYDNHSFLNFNGFHKKDACYNILNGGSSTNARNLLTGTVMRSSDGSMLCSVTYYDHRHRPSDVRSTYTDGVAVVMTTEYSFTGKPLTVQYTVYKDGATIPMTIENTYGEANDLPVSSVLKANGCETVLASNEYDGLGRLSKVTRGSNALYQQYSYNVRGWLTQITGNGFREELYYTDGAVPCYNGDISRVKWNGDTSTPTYSSYDFRYDSLDRLVASEYTLHADTEKKFDNSEYFTYNFNGSPLTLKRYGEYRIYSHSGYDLINNLSFTYSGNQLQNVSNTGAYPQYASPYVFHKNTATDIGYAYNSNGSMTRNPNRHIGLIEYDCFNNPRLIQFTDGSVTEYVYDASGVKLKTLHRTAVPGIEVPYGTVYEHTASTVLSSDSTLYAGPFVLSGDSLRYKYDGGSVLIPLDGSPVKPTFYALDHLGSVRLVVSADGQVMERSDYYPSGCMITGNITNEGNIQPYKYTGKELDPMHGLYTYDYGARQYDPATMLWDRMDPLCENTPEVSPYVFCGDNPENRIDLDGRQVLLSGDIQQALYALRQTLPSYLREYVIQNNGYIDLESLQKGINTMQNHPSTNYLSLVDIVKDSKVVELSITSKINAVNANGDYPQGLIPFKPAEYCEAMPLYGLPGGYFVNGSTGITLAPIGHQWTEWDSKQRNDLKLGQEQFSPNENYQVQINKAFYTQPETEFNGSEALTHELYGHLLFMFKGWDSAHGINRNIDNQDLEKWLKARRDETEYNFNH